MAAKTKPVAAKPATKPKPARNRQAEEFKRLRYDHDALLRRYQSQQRYVSELWSKLADAERAVRTMSRMMVAAEQVSSPSVDDFIPF